MPTGIIGKPMDRVDGRLKVTGAARYAGDAPVADVCHGVIVQSTVGNGRITGIDTSAAEALPGVLAVLTHKNVAAMLQPKADFMQGGVMGENRLPLSDDKVYYAGQHVAVVVARTLQQAQDGASRVKVTYDSVKPLVEPADAQATVTLPDQSFGEPLQYKRGDVDSALAAADAVKISQTYTTPIHTHNPMEPSGTVAVWDGDRLTVYDSTQWIKGTQAIVAEVFGIPRQNVRVLCPFVGGGFGCKGFIWPHTLLAVAAAKMTGRPVKILLTRAQMFTSTGHRPPTIQEMSLAAAKDGHLTGIRHVTTMETSGLGEFVEPCGLNSSRVMYACPNVDTPHKLLHVNVATPTFMRAPGEAVGTFALESAMDELAYALKIDPIQLRLINHADVEPHTGKQWSSKMLKECYQQGADKFGWKDRNPEPRSMRDGNLLVGWGVATATYPGYRFVGGAKVRLLGEGRAIVSSATHDLGTGAYTVFTQISANALGLPVDKVKFELGDSNFPIAPVAGGSNSTATISEAIIHAVDALKTKLIAMAVADPKSPVSGMKPEEVVIDGGAIQSRADATQSESMFDLITRTGKPAVEAEGMSVPGPEQEKFGIRSFGAQFCEVKVDLALAKARVTRFVSVIDCGSVINQKTARSQIMGGVIMGIGMALMEGTEYDLRTGHPVTDSLADYPVCVNADIRSIEPYFIGVPDPHINTLGCRGVGEIGITGTAAAVANAIYHATGKRIRDLPITPDKLL